MQRFFALIFTLAYTIQLMSPVIIWAQDTEPLFNVEVVQDSSTSSSDDNSSEQNSESTDTQSNESDQSSTDETTNENQSADSTSTDETNSSDVNSTPTDSGNSDESNPDTQSDYTPTPSPEITPSPTPIISPTPTVLPLGQTTPTPSPNSKIDPTATTSADMAASANNETNKSSNNSTDSSSSSDSKQSESSSSGGSDSTDVAATNEPVQLPDETELQTGNSAGVADSTTIINTQLQNSCLLIDTYNLTGEEDADFSDLYCANLTDQPAQSSLPTDQSNPETPPADDSLNQSSATPSPTPSPNNNFLTPTTSTLDNSAEVNQEVVVDANTGDNEAEAEDLAAILTGDAVALALIQQILNTTLIDSQLIYQIFNIWPSFFGDLILPRQDQVAADNSGNSDPCTNCGGAITLLNNDALINQNVEVTANSGGNSATGEETWIETGDAYAAANVINLANSELSDVGWYLLLFNVAGVWSGQLFNWNSEYEALGLPTGQFALTDNQVADLTNSNQSDSENDNHNSSSGFGNQSTVEINNQTTLTQNVQVSANTGGNTATAEAALISTGNAISIANLFNLINSRIVNSSLYIGIINILGNWTGNVQLAYPELAVSIGGNREAVPLGETVTYHVNYLNKGYDDADDAAISVNIPAGMEVISYSQAESGQRGSNSVSWNLGEVPEKHGGSLTVTLRATDWENLPVADSQKSWLSSLVPSAQAAANERQVTITTQISSTEPQSSTKANQAKVTTTIYQIVDGDDGSDGTDGEQSELPIGGQDSADNQSDEDSDSDANNWPMSLDVRHNVVGFIYPLDTVTFNVEVGNEADAPVKDLVVIHEIVQQGEVLVEIGFPLGELPAHKKGQLQFGLEIPDLAMAEYQIFETRTWVEARNNKGQSIVTPVKTTNFGVQPRLFGWMFENVPTVEAADGLLIDEAQAQPEVLGEQVVQSVSAETDQRRWWVLSGLLLAFLMIRIIRNRHDEIESNLS